ncbi:MAG: EAL domain-containing protein [Oscillatoriales cyanobacterium RM2_1_1]|nr:EAL domain-containing protein [Oscillatoriales cyanobacterium SM2_3_0]NJO46949.1 EAL domain-containing protein [Oscillatoriales cyanobacterium RM2_1_1]
MLEIDQEISETMDLNLQLPPDVDPKSVDILIVDDQPTNLKLLTRVLNRGGYEVRQALDGSLALQAIQARLPDLIMLDIMMPEMDGYQVCSQLKARAETAHIPVIFLSALDDVFDKVKAFSVGAVDYISKPFQAQEVLARVRHHLTLQAINRRISYLNSELEQQVKDRTQQLEEVHNRLRQLALYDELTGLPSRALFLEHLKTSLQQAQTHPDYQFAVLFLDCDRFQIINDSLGHLAGDQLLAAIGTRLKDALSEDNILGRLGGDEFAILLTPLDSIDTAIGVATRILKVLADPFLLKGYEVYVSVSMGIAIGNSNYTQPQQIVQDADTAMYRAKMGGDPRYQVFDPVMHQKAVRFLQIETDLHKAIVQRELCLNYQPIIDLHTGKLVGFETLVRWHHLERGFISPAEFIPVAEETGLIVPLGNWILLAACQQFRAWQEQELVDTSLSLNINLSARQFNSRYLLQQIDQTLEEVKLDPKFLKFEITESVILKNQNTAKILLEELRSRQISICLDDFGTGYSSLNYLLCFPIDTLKIDQSFIRRLDGSTEKLGLVPVILDIAQNLKLNVVAEGIETQAQLQQLMDLNCRYGQGYLFARPLDAEQATQFLINCKTQSNHLAEFLA